MLQFHWRSFSELNTAELYDILALRQNIFVIEQNCLYADMDYKDQKAKHLLAIIDGQLACYLRVFAPGMEYAEQASMGRILTAALQRNHGYARETVQEAIIYIAQNYPTKAIMMSAQIYLQTFYQSLGFHPVGEIYSEDGIPHIQMCLGIEYIGTR